MSVVPRCLRFRAVCLGYIACVGFSLYRSWGYSSLGATTYVSSRFRSFAWGPTFDCTTAPSASLPYSTSNTTHSTFEPIQNVGMSLTTLVALVWALRSARTCHSLSTAPKRHGRHFIKIIRSVEKDNISDSHQWRRVYRSADPSHP